MAMSETFIYREVVGRLLIQANYRVIGDDEPVLELSKVRVHPLFLASPEESESGNGGIMIGPKASVLTEAAVPHLTNAIENLLCS